MVDLRFGRGLRVLRRRRGWRQADLALRAGISQSAVARAELGRVGGLSVSALKTLADALGAQVDVRLRWQGEGLDRLLDREHAALVEQFVRRLRQHQWEVAPEASFSIFGERGSVDVLAAHRPTGALLVVEVKSVIPDVQTMLVALDRKTRLAPAIAKDRGWPSTTVSKLLIVREARTARRRLAQHDATFRLVLPIRGRSIEAWLRRPRGVLAGLLFLSPTSHPGGGRRTRPESVGVRSNSRSG